MITEFGAVKVRGGEVLGEFQTLVNPRSAIPPLIAVLTGITNQMVAGAPAAAPGAARVPDLRPGNGASWRTTPRSTSGFLRRACESLGYAVPALAGGRHRGAGPADPAARRGAELPAGHPGPALPGGRHPEPPGPDRRPGHRRRAARPDRAGRQPRRAHHRGSRRSSAAGCRRSAGPSAPGPPTCRTGPGSTCSSPSTINNATCSTSASPRTSGPGCAPTSRRPRSGPGWTRWCRVATGVEAVPCLTQLQADVTELRLIASHAPRYNRRSKFPERTQWIKITDEAYPRLSVVRAVRDDGATYFGPFGRRQAAEDVVLAIYDGFPIRQCTPRLSATSPTSACALAGMGRCSRALRRDHLPRRLRRDRRAGPHGAGRRRPAGRAGRPGPAAPAGRAAAVRGGGHHPPPAGDPDPRPGPGSTGSAAWPAAPRSSPPARRAWTGRST